MNDELADAVLRERGLAALEEDLGPVQALRFLAMISRQPFDYQNWRRQAFDGMTLSEILSQASAGQH
jgi:hypothetical protein